MVCLYCQGDYGGFPGRCHHDLGFILSWFGDYGGYPSRCHLKPAFFRPKGKELRPGVWAVKPAKRLLVRESKAKWQKNFGRESERSNQPSDSSSVKVKPSGKRTSAGSLSGQTSQATPRPWKKGVLHNYNRVQQIYPGCDNNRCNMTCEMQQVLIQTVKHKSNSTQTTI